MQGTDPIKTTTVLNLFNQQVDPKYLKFGICNFDGDKYISIKEPPNSADEKGNLIVVDMDNNYSITKKPNPSEYVLMHPSQNIIALKAKSKTGTSSILQIWNMAKQQRKKNLEIQEEIVFMKWVNNDKLGIITKSSVYHTDISNNDESEITKVMDRSGQLAVDGVSIIGYCLDSNSSWCCLYGISSPDKGKTILGHAQLFLIADKKQQLLDSHCCNFGQAYVHNDSYLSNLFCYFERKSGETTSRINITELTPPPQPLTKYKKQIDFPIDPVYSTDFPILMHFSQKYGLLIIATKYGYLSLIELTTGSIIYNKRMCEGAIFVGCKDTKQDGIYTINKNGQVLLSRIEDNALMPFIAQNCQFIPEVNQLVFKLAARYKLPGADGMFVELFSKMLIQQDYKQAAQIASNAPGALLRNPQTIQKFKSLQQLPGQPQPIIIYFQTLLDKGSLNKPESLELCGPVLIQGRKNYVENWVNDNKLECSEELGDLVKPYDTKIALDIYKKAKVVQKTMQCLMELGQMEELNKYQQEMVNQGQSIDQMAILKSTIQTNPESALVVAKSMYKQNSNINVYQIAEMFQSFQRQKEMTSFLVDCMVQNKPEDGIWQTKVLEYNLMAAPQVAEAILQMEKWNQYNRPKIASLCEQKGYFQRALENYSELKDIRRCIMNTHAINPEWVVYFLSKLQSDWCLACCSDLIKNNRNNVQIVVNVFQAQFQKLTLESCIKVFESVGSYDGIYMFLAKVTNQIDNKDIVFKYIEAATKCNQLRIVESIIKDQPQSYDPVKVKDFLKEIKLPDPKPLIYLCDIHGYVDELTKYLYKNNFQKYIEIYLFKVNPNAAPVVMGTLIDLECEENYIKQLLYNIRGNCPIEPLIEEFDKRNKVRVLENWLDSRVAEGIQLPSVHNALAKIKIDTNQDPENFLTNNQFYDPKVIGKFCEERDPHLAVIAYKRSWGTCDEELIMVTNKNQLFRLQARYLVERQSTELWKGVLSLDNPFRKQIIEQVVSTALPESKNVEEVSVTVQAFMEAGLPQELISLLEKIVLHNSEFGSYKKLQNLLIITAIKSEKTKVMDFINRLDNYDGVQIAKIALGKEYQLYEEAFTIYKKFNLYVDAIEVLLTYIEKIDRAAEFAEKVNQPEVWSKLGNAYLNQYSIQEAVDCYLKAKDSIAFQTVIGVAENEQKFELLIKYLIMARETQKDMSIDNSLAYAYAKTSKNTELEAFVNGSNSVDCQKVGDRCYDSKLYEAAKVLFTAIKNNAKIASCLVRLKQFQLAIESAKKANSPKTWKELCMACVEAQEFKLAAVAGSNIIIHPDHLEDLIKHYEEFQCPEEMISLLETGMLSDRAHTGIFTELGIMYAKYSPAKLMEHIKSKFQQLNISKLLRACEKYLLWKEVVYLYEHYDEIDNAINTMIEHSASAFSHESFAQLIQKINNKDLYYKSIMFYLEEQPSQINDILKVLASKIDLTRCVSVMKKAGYLPLIAPFLKTAQNVNNKEVNEALNEIYFETEDYTSLRESVTQYQNFDQLQLAKMTEKHELQEFRRIAAYLYRRHKQYQFSINLSKIDFEYRDCIETAQESRQPELVEELMRFFVQQEEKEFFTVCLYTCYDLVRPDVAMELAWRFGLMEHAMPFFIQITRELTQRIDTVHKKQDEREKKDKKQEEDRQSRPLDIVNDMFLPNLNQNVLMPPPTDFMNSSLQQQQPQFLTQQIPMNINPQGYQFNTNVPL